MNIILAIGALFLGVLFPFPVHGVCPLCTIAVVGGLGISRWFGIDDSVTGIWVGGVILSSGLWLSEWLLKKNWHIPYTKVIAIFCMFLFVIPPLYWTHMIGIAGNTLWGIDKVLLGTASGSGVFILAVKLDKWLRIMNGGKIYIYFQKVLIPVVLLTVTSYIFYVITN